MASYSSNNDTTDCAETWAPSVCFVTDVGDVKRPKALQNATNRSIVNSAITFNRIGSKEIGFGSNLILNDLV